MYMVMMNKNIKRGGGDPTNAFKDGFNVFIVCWEGGEEGVVSFNIQYNF